jgi:hypothetical protein
VVTRRELELHHAALLVEHGLAHLDLHEITSSRRSVTQMIAGDVHDRLHGAGIRFASGWTGGPATGSFKDVRARTATARPSR